MHFASKTRCPNYEKSLNSIGKIGIEEALRLGAADLSHEIVKSIVSRKLIQYLISRDRWLGLNQGFAGHYRVLFQHNVLDIIFVLPTRLLEALG